MSISDRETPGDLTRVSDKWSTKPTKRTQRSVETDIQTKATILHMTTLLKRELKSNMAGMYISEASLSRSFQSPSFRDPDAPTPLVLGHMHTFVISLSISLSLSLNSELRPFNPPRTQSMSRKVVIGKGGNCSSLAK
eukprot:1327327-Amorphochlora_amoeboformis.AAC.1